MPNARSSNDIVNVPDAPPIQGLSFRRFRGEPDFKILADVMQRRRDADLFEFVETSQDTTSNPAFQVLLGYPVSGPGPFLFIPDIFTALAACVLIYLSIE